MKLYSSSNVVVCLIVGLALSPLTVLAQGTTTYSGQATALKATALGISITLADTGPLPSTGGSITRDLPSISVAGLITATRGNHGQSLAFAASRYRMPVTIYVPHGNSVEKNRAMRAFGAKLVEHGDDFQAAREETERRARLDGLELVPSFHPDLVRGVATYALELLRKVPDLEVLYVPIGQGSGICGCILARDLLGLTTEIVGVQSTEAPSYALSFAAGTVVTTKTSNTLADGMATRVPDAEALAIIRKGASRIVQVTDREVAAAIRAYWTDTHNIAEGAGAAALAAALQDKPKICGKRVGLILTGGNIDFDLFNTWIIPEAAALAGGKALV